MVGDEYSIPESSKKLKDGKCGKYAAPFIPRWGMFYACVLDEGHEGRCRQGGTCFTHGSYVGEKCLHWPKCLQGQQNSSRQNLTNTPR